MKTKLEQKIDNLKNSDAEFAIECINLREEEIIEMIVKKLDFLNNILNKEANETDKLVNQLGVNVAIKSLEDLMKLIKGEK